MTGFSKQQQLGPPKVKSTGKIKQVSNEAAVRAAKLSQVLDEIDQERPPLCEPYKSSGELWAIIPRIIAKLNPEFRYLFVQHWNLMDKTKQKNLVNDLLELGFQLCIEVVDETENGGVVVLAEIT